MYHATSPTHRHRGANRERIRLSVLPPGERTVPPKYVIISTGDTGIPRPREEFDQNVSRYSAGMPGELRVSPRPLLPPFLRRLRFLRLLRRVCSSHPFLPPPSSHSSSVRTRSDARSASRGVSTIFGGWEFREFCGYREIFRGLVLSDIFDSDFDCYDNRSFILC